MQESNEEPKLPQLETPKHRHGILYSLTIVALLIAIFGWVAQIFFYMLYQQKFDHLSERNKQIDSYVSGFQTVQAGLNEQKKTIQALINQNQKEEKRQSVLPAQEAELL